MASCGGASVWPALAISPANAELLPTYILPFQWFPLAYLVHIREFKPILSLVKTKHIMNFKSNSGD